MNTSVLQVVRGDATPEEIAALVAVLTARARPATAARSGPATRRRSGWADRPAGLRAPLPRGPGAWRAVARPR